MWTVYFPFSTQEVSEQLEVEQSKLQRDIQKRLLEESTYSDSRGEPLKGYHNYVDIVSYCVSQRHPYVHPNRDESISFLLDLLANEYLFETAEYAEALSSKEAKNLWCLLKAERPDFETNPSNLDPCMQELVEKQTCLHWVLNYDKFARIADRLII